MHADEVFQLSDDMPVNQHPTRRNIMNGLDWLMKDQRNGDSLFFFFAGRQWVGKAVDVPWSAVADHVRCWHG